VADQGTPGAEHSVVLPVYCALLSLALVKRIFPAEAIVATAANVRQTKINFLHISTPPLLQKSNKLFFFFWLQAKKPTSRDSTRIHNSAPGVDSPGYTPDDRHNYVRLPNTIFSEIDFILLLTEDLSKPAN
jgi:hypothetical protein